MELGACRAGTVVRIVQVDVDPAARLRFGELGLRAGALVQVTHDVGAQGRVVAVGADRFALDSATCARITVEPATAGAVGGAVVGAVVGAVAGAGGTR